ncbi:MAG: ABC transporter substrate-binding protein [Firmicutes bacterium]|nr:ABC transporter substrate-binding protein [Bacillota bacterium]
MDDQELLNSSWDKIESTARNSEVNFYMWGGDRRINQWIDTFVSNQMQELYNIELNRVPMGPDDYLNKLLGEKQIGRKKGTIDLLWINGENFKTAKENGLLFGPFAELLPNYSHYLDTSSPETTMDFGFPTEGYEVPYGKAQFVFIYDKAKINNPPHSFRGLVDWIKDNPGKFTYPALPDFTGSAFIRHVIYAQTGGYKQYCNLSEKEVRDKIKPAMKLLNDIKPYLWRKGKTYPATIAQLHNMFADGEVWMTMSYHPTKASGEIVKGNFPETVRTFVLEDGTISNTHFLAIPFNAPNKSGALVVANYLEGFEAQLSKYKPANWGDMPVFSFDKLSEAEKEKVDGVDLGIATLDQKTLQDHRLPEIPAQFIPVIEDVWDSTVAQ